MPVMSEQVRKTRAERLLVLRFEEGLSPTDAWREVRPTSKATDGMAAELCRRDIRWYRGEHSSVDVLGESRVVLEGDEAGDPASASLAGGASVEVTGDAAATPKKRCAGVADRPCGKVITERRTRCEDCGKEHRRLERQVYNRNYYVANKWGRWAKRIKSEVEAHFAAEREAAEKRVEAEAERKREIERRRQARIEAQREAGLKRIEAEMEAERVARKAEEDRIAKLPRVRRLEDGRFITEYFDGRRELRDPHSERSKMLEPGEPIPPRRIRFPTLDPWRR